MSTSSTEFEKLLREAVSKAKSSAPRAVDDLFQCASTAADAVFQVTEKAATLELLLVNQMGASPQTYQLQLRKNRSEAPSSDLGIFCLSPTGYPIQRWYSKRKWEADSDHPDELFANKDELEGHFKWMISHPESKVVILVAFFQQQTATSL
jgi:hypothetical protein